MLRDFFVIDQIELLDKDGQEVTFEVFELQTYDGLLTKVFFVGTYALSSSTGRVLTIRKNLGRISD